MKRFLSPLLILSILISATCFAYSQDKINLTGTWQGPTTANGPDFEIPLVLTVVLKQSDGKITGKLYDDAGYVDGPITKVKVKNNVFTFEAVAQTPDGDIGLKFELNMKKDTLDGKWDGNDGTYGNWKALRKKAEKINLTGTWAGLAYTPDGEDSITADFKQVNDKITGTMSTASGSLNNSPIKNGKLQNGKLYLETVVFTPEGEETAIIKGTVKGKNVSGTWEIPSSGDSGTWKMAKK